MMTVSKSGSTKKRLTVTATAALSILMVSAFSAQAADITDTASCDTEVAKAEKQIVRAPLSAEDLHTLVGLADQAKTACSGDDFAKASKITGAIEAKLKQVSSQ